MRVHVSQVSALTGAYVGFNYAIYVLLFKVFSDSSVEPGTTLVVQFALMTVVIAQLALLSRNILNTHLFFLLYLFIYAVLVPILVIYVDVSIYLAQYVRDNPASLVAANSYIMLGLLPYACIAVRDLNTEHPQRPGTDLSPRAYPVAAVVLLGVGILIWSVLFIKSGSPLSAFAGALEGRDRGQFSDITGREYVKSLLFCFNIATLLILAFIYKSSKFTYLIAAVFFAYVIVVANVFDGQRLFIVGGIMSLILLFEVMNLSSRPALQRSKYLVAPRLNLRYILFGVSLVLFLMLYGQYRSQNIGVEGATTRDILYEQSTFYFANVFDSATTYPFVVDQIDEGKDFWFGKSLYTPILNRIPRTVFPTIYDHIYGSGRFAEEFLGFDHYDVGTVSRSCSVFCDAYLNFGGFGVIIAIVLFALANSYMNRTLVQKTENLFFVVLWITYISYFLPYVFKSSFPQAISLLDFRLGFFLLVLFFAQVVVSSNRVRRVSFQP